MLSRMKAAALGLLLTAGNAVADGYRVLWNYQAPSAVTAISEYSGKQRLIGITSENSFLVLSADGKEIAKHDAEQLTSAEFVDANKDGVADYLLCQRTGNLRLINGRTGKSAWLDNQFMQSPFEGLGVLFFNTITSAPKTDSSGIYVASHMTGGGYSRQEKKHKVIRTAGKGYVTKFDLRTDKMLWQSSFEQCPFYSSPLLTTDSVFAAFTYEGKLYRLDKETGELTGNPKQSMERFGKFSPEFEVSPILFDYNKDKVPDIAVAYNLCGMKIFDGIDLKELFAYSLIPPDKRNKFDAIINPMRVMNVDGLEDTLFTTPNNYLHFALQKKGIKFSKIVPLQYGLNTFCVYGPNLLVFTRGLSIVNGKLDLMNVVDLGHKKVIDTTPDKVCQPLLIDLNNDNSLEIICADQKGNVRAIELAR